MGDKDITEAYRFNTQLLDFLEGFSPRGGSPCSVGTHLTQIGLGLIVPAIPIYKIYTKVWPKDVLGAVLYALGGMGFYVSWFVCQVVEVETRNVSLVAWLMFFGFLCIVIHLRVEMRQKYNVFGSPIDDISASLVMHPFVLAQCAMMADTDGKDAPRYYASADEMIQEMANLASNATPPVVKGEMYQGSGTSVSDVTSRA
jgi:hypothetical protein